MIAMPLASFVKCQSVFCRLDKRSNNDLIKNAQTEQTIALRQYEKSRSMRGASLTNSTLRLDGILSRLRDRDGGL